LNRGYFLKKLSACKIMSNGATKKEFMEMAKNSPIGKLSINP
jgi:hypothetical protein